MSRRGYGSNWQNPNNPNMAPLPPRASHRPGIGSARDAGYGSQSTGGGGGGYQGGPPPSAPPPIPAAATASASMGGPSSRHHSHGHHGLPPPPHSSSYSPGISSSTNSQSSPFVPSTSSGAEVATTLFIGSISPGITDKWLTKLLETCGPLKNLKRATKAFGFAEYSDPDSVLRAINVLNGRELPVMGNEAVSGQPKKLLVKADEKTKKFLDQYQHTRITTDDDERSESNATKAVKSMIREMSASNATEEDESNKRVYEVPAHLKDLPPEELPEEHRGSVLSEIEQFRQAAAAREEADRKREAELEKQRALERARKAGQQSAATANGKSQQDPQSYQKPVKFVTSSQDGKPDADRDPEELDEIHEAKRLERKQADLRAAAAEAERMYISKERQRLAFWEKEADRERKDKEQTDREAIQLFKKWQDWQDEIAYDKELFYTDRKRWRHFRSQFRKREEEADERDRAAEKEGEEKARQETERFLAQQAADMAALAEQQRAAGILIPQEGGLHAPLKLNLTNAAKNDGAAEAGLSAPAPKTLLGEADDDDSTKKVSRLKQIEFGVTEEQRKEKIQKLEESVPTDPASLFKLQPRWDWIDESIIQTKYKQWADAEITESLGEQVEELVDFIVETLQAHKGAEEFVEGIEPVLAEEAEGFVVKLWRMVIVDSLAATAGLRV